jgi:RTX calcium-binding nonapeptide repeat (4 copies)
MKHHGLAASIAALGCMLLATGAHAQSGSRQSAELRFLEREPGTPTALDLNIDYVNPADPNAKPPAVRRVVEELAEGSQIDTSIPARCPATDAQLMVQGPAACPADSRVGQGTVTIDTGLPGPARFIVADTVFLNNTNQLILVSTERGSGARVVTRASASGRRIVTELVPLPGTPPDGGAIDVVNFRLNQISRVIGGVPRGYITTPGNCPESRNWRNSLTFTYADGVSQLVNTDQGCIKSDPGAGKGRCSDDRNGSPRRDLLVGTSVGDRLFGLRGSDRLAGRRGDDCLHGHRGRDLLLGGPGADVLRGGAGFDICRGGPGVDRLRGCERRKG